MKQGTIAAQIREKIDLIAALVKSTKPGGGRYSYGEVLRLAGLPDNKRYVRELSNQLIAAGYRRHKAKVRKPAEDVPQPGDVLLDADNGDYGEKDEIAAALNSIARDLIVIAKAAGLPGYRIISIDDPAND